MGEAPQIQVDRKRSRRFILVCLSIGHGVAHLYDQGFPLFFQEIASYMGFSNFRVASLLAIRRTAQGAVNLGGGPLVDMLKRQWGLILTGCMLWSGISFLLVGASPNFAVLVVAVTLLSIPGSMWHLPATAAISQRFPDRRGFAISIHGAVASLFNPIGPLLAGVLLSVLFWRNALFIFAVPALLVSVFVWWSLKEVGKEDGQEERKELGARFLDAVMLVKNPIVLGLVLAAMVRGIGLGALAYWTPFYLRDELGMGHIEAGFHLGLLTGLGIVSAPLLGALSDRFGRKVVLVPGFIAAATLSLLVVSTGDSFMLALVLAGMGLFSFALHQIIQAAALDVVGRGREATTIGLLFGLNGVIGAGSPFLTALVIDHLGGYGTIFYYAGILTLVTAVIIIIIPIPNPKTRTAADV